MKSNFCHILFLFFTASFYAQTSDSLSVKTTSGLLIEEQLIKKEVYEPLAPARAAFYSAVVPGLGQAYNKKYWKIPIIYAGMAAGIYFYKQNDDDYDRFRNAYKRRLAGYTDDEFYGDGDEPLISTDRLINAQKSSQKNKDLSIIVTVAFYLLNVIDANVDAHLRQYEVSEDLSLEPNFEVNPMNAQTQYGMSLRYKLN